MALTGYSYVKEKRMSPTVKTFLWIGGIAAVLLGASKIAAGANQFSDLKNQLQLYVGVPSINSNLISNGFINLPFEQMKIMNQSIISGPVNNLFVTVQYQNLKTGTWQNWILQTKGIETFSLLPHQLNNIPPVLLSIPIDLGFISDLLSNNIGSQLKIITRFSFYGVSLSLEALQDASFIFNRLKSNNYITA